MTPQPHFDLSSFNTFGLTAHADWGLIFDSMERLRAVLADARWSSLPRLVLGGGSNVLFTDDFAGLVLINRLQGIEINELSDGWQLQVAAGESWPGLVEETLRRGIPGLENMALIPGTVGAAPVQNIGAYGVELCQFCTHVDALEVKSGTLVRIPAAECGFGYRESHFKQTWRQTHIIVGVGLFLPKQWHAQVAYGPLRSLGDAPSALQIFDEVCRLRREKLPQPELLGNAGSFFKNPTVAVVVADRLAALYPAMPLFPQHEGGVKLAAGWLIDQAGLKGMTVGRAAVHQQQALVLVNLGGARAGDLVQLACEVRNRVLAQFDVDLEPEVRFIGKQGDTTLEEAMRCVI